MTRSYTTELRFDMDASNPGQFFACCGLFELAFRYYEHVETWFERNSFVIRAAATSFEPTCESFLASIGRSDLEPLDPEDQTASPLLIGRPFEVRLDWWQSDRDLKVWAGSMRSLRIASAMKTAMQVNAHAQGGILNFATVVFDPVETSKKVEPFYFDARRGASAQAIDIGFSPDALQMTSAAYPAVEFLCLVGLQRFRPRRTNNRRVFEYSTWVEPICIQVAQAAVNALLPHIGSATFRFENAFRTDQRKHKAFTPASKI